MMRRSQRTRLGKRRRIEEAGEVEAVPEAEGEVASEAVDGDVVVGGVSRLDISTHDWWILVRGCVAVLGTTREPSDAKNLHNPRSIGVLGKS